MVLFLNRLVLTTFIFSFLVSCSSKPHFTPQKSKLKDVRIPFIFTDIKVDRVEHNQVKLSDGSTINRKGDEVNSSLESLEIENFIQDEVVYSKNDNLVAYITEDNSIVLLDFKTKETLFKERFNYKATIDRRLPKPIFDKGSVLYFTLDGKIAIYSTKAKKIVRVVSVNDSNDYSNVIDYRLTKDSLILVTHKNLLMITDSFDDKLALNLRGSIFEKDSFFLITKDGEIREYDYSLVLKKSIKFPFAYFVSFGKIDETIYLIESQGYVIELNSDLENYKVTPTELDEENCFFTDKKFICDEKFFRLPLSI